MVVKPLALHSLAASSPIAKYPYVHLGDSDNEKCEQGSVSQCVTIQFDRFRDFRSPTATFRLACQWDWHLAAEPMTYHYLQYDQRQ